MFQLEGMSPTPSSASNHIFLTVSAGLQDPIRCTNINCQVRSPAGQADHKGALRDAAKEEGVPGLDARQLLRLEKEVYCTVMSTAQWRTSTIETLEQLAHQLSRLDTCCFLQEGAT